MGVVTAQGERTGVYAEGCQRLLPVAAPGGYRWKPKNGQQVLVMKSGVDGEAACIVAQRESADNDLNPGELELFADGCSIRLSGDGQVRLKGEVLVNGVSLEAVIEAAVLQALAGQEGT
ncbi:MAG: hypothetical protein E7450_06310 [Ruminococcaceae bacterium]|nr:hypothetical protein [Oscillospiraceae bacterium]